MTALTKAAICGDMATVLSLLRQGANADEANERTETPLICAIYARRVDIAEVLLKAGADVNKLDKWGHTPLIEAANGGCVSIVMLLVEYGANLNCVDTNGDTPLLAALWRGDLRILATLLDNGADLDILRSDRGMETMACVKSKKDFETLEIVETALRLKDKKAADRQALQSAQQSFCNGKPLAEIFAAENWVGNFEGMKKKWLEVPAPLKETFDFATALTEAQQDSLPRSKFRFSPGSPKNS